MNTLQDLHYTASEQERADFYRKTYTHVAGAVLAFIILEYILLSSPVVVNAMASMTQGYLWLVLLGGFYFATNYAANLAHRVDRTMQYVGLGIYVVAYALLFVPMLYMATQMSDPYIISQAGYLTIALFAGLSAVAFYSGANFSFLRSALMVGSFVAIGLIVVGILFGFNLGLWFSVFMVLLSAGSILYQTSELKYEYPTDAYVGAAVGLFSSVMLMFWYILRIFMSRD